MIKKILTTILLLLIITFTLLLYSRFIGIKGLKTNEITIKSNIPESYDGLKIVHFADIHYKKVITENKIKKLIKEINTLKPDIVLFTGDLTDKDYTLKGEDINFLIKQLSKIETKYGNYAILGDQDIKNKETVHNIYIQSNFILLENETTIIQNEKGEKISLSGITSSTKTNIQKTINTIKDDITYQIVLAHEPDSIDELLKEKQNISLILSSHSINGSINIPIIKRLFLPKGAKKYFKPHYKINNTEIYISNGIGVNKINFRLFNTPSINFYRFKRKN